jgi:peroxisomal coenzyme A diphosphatase NUDT7
MNSKKIINQIREHTPTILGSKEYSKYAVLLPLVEVDDEIHVLFEVRSLQMRRQPGEICFPGGRIDKADKSEQAAAVRETTEELGIGSEQIADVYPLDYLVSPFGMMIFPFVGFIKNDEKIKPNQSEVDEVFTVPISFFIEKEPSIHYVNVQVKPDKKFPLDLIAGGENYNWRTSKIDEYFYQYEDKVIWGLTAKILSHFIELIKEK